MSLLNIYQRPSFSDRIQRIEEDKGKVFVPNETHSEEIKPVSLSFTVLIDIIRGVARYFTLKEILELMVLSKKIYAEILDEDLYSYMCCMKLNYTCADRLIPSNVLSHFEEMTGISLSSYQELFKRIRNSHNLIKNHSLEQDFDNWDIINRGSNMSFWTNSGFKDKKKIVCTSYEWCTLSQFIDLPEGKDRVVVVGTAACRRVVCGAEAYASLEIGSEQTEIQEVLPDDNPTYDLCGWKILKIKGNVGTEATRIKAKFSGKDTKFWAGQYGAYFGYFFAFVYDLDEESY